MAYDDEGFLTSHLSNPWVSLPWAVASGLGAAASPALGRGLGVANSLLLAGVASEATKRKEAERKRLSQVMAPIFDATTDKQVTKTGLDPQKTEFSMPNTRLSEISTPSEGESDTGIPGSNILSRPPLPTYQATEQVPVYSDQDRQLLKAMSQADPEAAAKLAIEMKYKKLEPPPKPDFATQGGEALETHYDPTRGWVTTRKPLTPAPIAPERAEDMDERRAIAIQAGKDRVEAARRADETRRDLAAQSDATRRDIAGATNALRADLAADKKNTVKNPSDWMRFDEASGDVITAPTNITPEELKAQGFREIKSLKDRQAILSSGMGLDLQFQKVQELANQYKNTSAPSLIAGKWTGGQIGSSIGATMEGTGRQMIQFLEKELGGVRAAGSKPLLDAASSFLLPTAIDSNELIDLKMQGLKVLVDGLRDAPKRAAFGLAIDPRTKVETQKFIDMVKDQAAKERGEKPKPTAGTRATPGAPATQTAPTQAPKRLKFDARGNPVP